MPATSVNDRSPARRPAYRDIFSGGYRSAG